MTLFNTILQASDIQFYNASYVYCIACSPPQIKSPWSSIFPFTLLHLPFPLVIPCYCLFLWGFFVCSFLLNPFTLFTQPHNPLQCAQFKVLKKTITRQLYLILIIWGRYFKVCFFVHVLATNFVDFHWKPIFRAEDFGECFCSAGFLTSVCGKLFFPSHRDWSKAELCFQWHCVNCLPWGCQSAEGKLAFPDFCFLWIPCSLPLIALFMPGAWLLPPPALLELALLLLTDAAYWT